MELMTSVYLCYTHMAELYNDCQCCHSRFGEKGTQNGDKVLCLLKKKEKKHQKSTFGPTYLCSSAYLITYTFGVS